MKESTPDTICEICGDNTEELYSCSICGAAFCELCGSESRCHVCEEAICYICNTYLASRACNDCGRLVCESHSVKNGEATICEQCQTS